MYKLCYGLLIRSVLIEYGMFVKIAVDSISLRSVNYAVT